MELSFVDGAVLFPRKNGGVVKLKILYPINVALSEHVLCCLHAAKVGSSVMEMNCASWNTSSRVHI